MENESLELFYMKKGDMVVRVFTQGNFKDIPIKEGEIFLLPARIPHSPQRVKDTIGLVIERERTSEELDCIRWYVDDSKDILYERWVNVTDLGTQVASTIKEFFQSEQYKTNKPIPGTILSNPPFGLNEKCTIANPFSLKEWIIKNKSEIDQVGFKSMFDEDYQTQVIVHGSGELDCYTGLLELFVWQLRGNREFNILGKKYLIEAGDTLLIPQDVSFESVASNDCLTLTVKMDRYSHETTNASSHP